MYVTRLFGVILEFNSTVSKHRLQFNGTWMFNEIVECEMHSYIYV